MTELPVINPGDYSFSDVNDRFKHMEIQINTMCDVATCFGCDRFSDVIGAPAMTVAQVRLFVQESLEIGWEWERIRLLGGEPTIHRDFLKMVDLLLDYRDNHYPKCFIQVLTDGHGKADKYREQLEKSGVSLHSEAKEKGVIPPWFNNTRIAPIDRDPGIGAIPPCSIFGKYGCGIGLTNGGYFLDGAGAACALVAGLDIGIMHLKNVTWESMLEQSKVLCRVCGHWNSLTDPPVTEKVSKTGTITGPYWTEKLREYNKGNTPKLRVYGEC